MPLCQVALSTTDLARSSQWYRRTFNWQTAGETREREGDVWARVPGLPEAHFKVSCLVEQRPFFQFELFEFLKPRMRRQRSDTRPIDIGFSQLGLHVPHFDAVLARLSCTGGVLLTEPIGEFGHRRVCLRDPDGVLLELIETSPTPAAQQMEHDPPLATTCSVTLSVPDLDMASRFWSEALGLTRHPAGSLHHPEDERLWGIKGAERRDLVLDAGDFAVELVQYMSPKPGNRPAGYLLSDQGILNVALGTTERGVFDAVFTRAERAGFRPCHPPWDVPQVATVVYLQDGQGFTVELLYVHPEALERMGFASGPVTTTAAAPRPTARPA
jgi:catechol 2,3-dioxygenase-like lactoylglutathione lyase family enzyme